MFAPSDNGTLTVSSKRPLTEEELDYHFTEQINFIYGVLETYPDMADYALCMKWIKVLKNTTKAEKLPRNHLTALLLCQVSEKKCVMWPFNDQSNCNRNLVKVVEDYNREVRRRIAEWKSKNGKELLKPPGCVRELSESELCEPQRSTDVWRNTKKSFKECGDECQEIVPEKLHELDALETIDEAEEQDAWPEEYSSDEDQEENDNELNAPSSSMKTQIRPDSRARDLQQPKLNQEQKVHSEKQRQYECKTLSAKHKYQLRSANHSKNGESGQRGLLRLDNTVEWQNTLRDYKNTTTLQSKPSRANRRLGEQDSVGEKTRIGSKAHEEQDKCIRERESRKEVSWNTIERAKQRTCGRENEQKKRESIEIKPKMSKTDVEQIDSGPYDKEIQTFWEMRNEREIIAKNEKHLREQYQKVPECALYDEAREINYRHFEESQGQEDPKQQLRKDILRRQHEIEVKLKRTWKELESLESAYKRSEEFDRNEAPDRQMQERQHGKRLDDPQFCSKLYEQGTTEHNKLKNLEKSSSKEVKRQEKYVNPQALNTSKKCESHALRSRSSELKENAENPQKTGQDIPTNLEYKRLDGEKRLTAGQERKNILDTEQKQYSNKIAQKMNDIYEKNDQWKLGAPTKLETYKNLQSKIETECGRTRDLSSRNTEQKASKKETTGLLTRREVQDSSGPRGRDGDCKVLWDARRPNPRPFWLERKAEHQKENVPEYIQFGRRVDKGHRPQESLRERTGAPEILQPNNSNCKANIKIAKPLKNQRDEGNAKDHLLRERNTKFSGCENQASFAKQSTKPKRPVVYRNTTRERSVIEQQQQQQDHSLCQQVENSQNQLKIQEPQDVKAVRNVGKDAIPMKQQHQHCQTRQHVSNTHKPLPRERSPSVSKNPNNVTQRCELEEANKQAHMGKPEPRPKWDLMWSPLVRRYISFEPDIAPQNLKLNEECSVSNPQQAHLISSSGVTQSSELKVRSELEHYLMKKTQIKQKTSSEYFNASNEPIPKQQRWERFMKEVRASETSGPEGCRSCETASPVSKASDTEEGQNKGKGTQTHIKAEHMSGERLSPVRGFGQAEKYTLVGKYCPKRKIYVMEECRPFTFDHSPSWLSHNEPDKHTHLYTNRDEQQYCENHIQRCSGGMTEIPTEICRSQVEAESQTDFKKKCVEVQTDQLSYPKQYITYSISTNRIRKHVRLTKEKRVPSQMDINKHYQLQQALRRELQPDEFEKFVQSVFTERQGACSNPAEVRQHIKAQIPLLEHKLVEVRAQRLEKNQKSEPPVLHHKVEKDMMERELSPIQMFKNNKDVVEDQKGEDEKITKNDSNGNDSKQQNDCSFASEQSSQCKDVMHPGADDGDLSDTSSVSSDLSPICTCATCNLACASLGGCSGPLSTANRRKLCELIVEDDSTPNCCPLPEMKVFYTLFEPLLTARASEEGKMATNIQADVQLRKDIDTLDVQLEAHLSEMFKQDFAIRYKSKLIKRAVQLQRKLRHDQNVKVLRTWKDSVRCAAQDTHEMSGHCFHDFQCFFRDQCALSEEFLTMALDTMKRLCLSPFDKV